jgi:hypothetical protein
MENKLKRLNELISGIKTKIELLQKLNILLKDLNYSLDAFLIAVETYSCYDKTHLFVSKDLDDINSSLQLVDINSSNNNLCLSNESGFNKSVYSEGFESRYRKDIKHEKKKTHPQRTK